VVAIVERWAAGKSASEWLFSAPAGGPLRETNWERSVRWREAIAAIGRPSCGFTTSDTLLLSLAWFACGLEGRAEAAWPKVDDG